MFLHIDTIILGVCGKACPNYPKQQNDNSSQCLYNISKKKLGMEFIFCMQINIYKLGLLFLMEVARYVQSTKNRKLAIFLQYIKKIVSQLLLCSIVMRNIQIFCGGQIMFLVTCFLAQPNCGNFWPLNTAIQ